MTGDNQDPQPGLHNHADGSPQTRSDIATNGHIADDHGDRLAEAVSVEMPPRLPFTVVGVGASAGGLEAYTEFIRNITPDSGMAYVLIQHLSPKHESLMVDILARHTTVPIDQVSDGMAVEADHIYAIRPGYTMTIKEGRLHLGANATEPGHRRPVDDFFRSLAEEQRERAVCVILSGTGSNGTAGAEAIKAVGGICIAQDPETAKFDGMPRSLIDAGLADAILLAADMPAAIARYSSHPYIKEPATSLDDIARREKRALNEVLAILRTRVRHDFAGYKKATVIRRIQRRMSLMQFTQMPDYLRALRQMPSEAIALADDLMIHVTGFFRDAEAWESLRVNVIVPMVADKADESSIRAWVTACASGEEAYTVAILLVEAAEAAGKHFDMKIFATDTSARTLGSARAGVYPGGIEGEITPARLARFFDKDDGFFRIKKELRELVIFAPQNVLQDPPFSRLDLCTCRNLLIYIESDVQRRLLSLLHFGLRESGTLMLGTSETVGESEHLFEAIDKKHRIYRKIGPARAAALDFPLPPTALTRNAAATSVDPADDADRLSRSAISHLARAMLLDRFTPAAVVVDRSAHIVYFHGNTDLFLTHPRGEPTSDLLQLCRDDLRGAVRSALSGAIADLAPVHVRDGLIGSGEQQRRIVVLAAPLESKNPSYFLVGFTEQSEPDANDASSSRNPESQDMHDELGRIRHELQSTIEELQTSNEEMKASHEEVTSINEELQSANEELETSKEELQSLNEELTTVNAQLQDKMEQLERTSNDLGSLLSSTDIAVVFLDTTFRIRRFTPAAKDLVDLIPSDIGRPLSDLAQKFNDPTLLDDARKVLDRLTPAEREIGSHSGRWYMRRALPYRTADNRIDGVVVTFVDITARRAAELALRHSEEHHRLIVQGIHEHAIFVLDLQGSIVTWNPAAERVLGFTQAEAIGQFGSIIFTPEDRAAGADRAELDTALLTGRALDERWHVRKDGSRLWASGSMNVLYNEDGTPRGFVKILRDDTERKRREEAIRASEARNAAIIANAAVGLGELSLDGKVIRANGALCRILGRTTDQLRGMNIADLTFTEDVAIATLALREAIAGDKPVSLDTRQVRPDGTLAYVDISLSRLDDEKGNARSVSAVTVDLTARREAEASVRAGERLYRALAANLPQGAAFVVGRDYRYRLAAGEALNELSLTAQAVEGKTIEEALGKELAARFEPHYRSVFAGKSFRFEQEAHGRHFITHGAPLRDAAGHVYAALAVSYDITERKRVEEDLKIAKELAEAANTVKDEFLATLSHELRTPLSAIMIWTKLMRSQSISETQREEGLQAIEQSAEAQKQLIDDLLDSSRITSGKLRFEMSEIALASLIGNSVETIGPAARAKGLTVQTNLDDTAGVVHVDANRLRQILSNLLTNAVKFTPAGGRIDVELRRHDSDQVEISISDTGRGIAPDFLPHVFERFSQSDPSMTPIGGGIGLGLGLAIVKQLVELHGGTIAAESNGLGEGATFRVLLPLRAITGRDKPS